MSEIDPYEREAAKAAINTLQRELAKTTAERDELVAKYRIHHDEAERLTREIAEVRKEYEKWADECEKNMALLEDSLELCEIAVKQRDTLAEAVNEYTIEHAKRGAVSTATINQLERALAAMKGGKP
jgi:polyhydroxyalkanoate synthesis regulator phasin